MKKRRLTVFFSVLVIMSVALLVGCPGGAGARRAGAIRDGGTFDIAVVGSGGAGFGAVIYILQNHPDLSILFIEQNGFTGAMTRSTAGHAFNTEWIDADGTGLSTGRIFTRQQWIDWTRMRTFNAPVVLADVMVLGTDPSHLNDPAHGGPTGSTFPNQWPLPETHREFFDFSRVIHGWPNNPVYPDGRYTFYLARRIREFSIAFRSHMGFDTGIASHRPHGSIAQGSYDTWIDQNHPGLLRRWHRAIGLIQDEPGGRITGIRYEILEPNWNTRPRGVSFQVNEVHEARIRLGVIMATGNRGQSDDILTRYGQPVPGFTDAVGIQNVGLLIDYARLDGTAHDAMLAAGAASHPITWGAITWLAVSSALQDVPEYGPVFYGKRLTPAQIAGGASLDPWDPNFNTHAIVRPITTLRRHAVIVDGNGERFRGETNFQEAQSGGDAPVWGAHMATANTWPYWIIFSADWRGDPRFNVQGWDDVYRCAIAGLEAAANNPGRGFNTERNRWEYFSDQVKTGGTLMDLATNMGIPADRRQAFVNMIAAYDTAVAAAHAGNPATDWRDPLLNTHPNAPPKRHAGGVFETIPAGAIPGENLIAFGTTGPFYAVQIHPSSHEFYGGIITNRYGQTLTNFAHLGGVPAAGGNLYATGGASNRDHWGLTYRVAVSVLQNATASAIAVSHLMASNGRGDTFHLPIDDDDVWGNY
ncbi:MAG: FAD-binding protein [Defluviitaleaceae bacterium]|nr:FAD-binding protein [Defluviitaleaceae bacterium]